MARSYAIVSAPLAFCIVLFASTGAGCADGREQGDALARKFFELREQTLDERGTPAKSTLALDQRQAAKQG
jgi:hypothetical protein